MKDILLKSALAIAWMCIYIFCGFELAVVGLLTAIALGD